MPEPRMCSRPVLERLTSWCGCSPVPAEMAMLPPVLGRCAAGVAPPPVTAPGVPARLPAAGEAAPPAAVGAPPARVGLATPAFLLLLLEPLQPTSPSARPPVIAVAPPASRRRRLTPRAARRQ